tara:strand:- start:425 stop:1672 length:1248 start_codon:yes stop_codon:yes gene_type:complete
MTNAPPLRDDCFVMPRGVKWTPVEEALEKLHKSLKNIKKTSVIPVSKCCGRILAEDVVAQTNHPPFSNSAVDGYGFALSALPDQGEIELKLTTGRSAAGNFYFDKVPAGYGLRILTGAQIPDGVDTVILEEDVNKIKDIIYFNSGLKKGANIRAKGEDILSGSTILQKSKKLSPADLGVLASSGVKTIKVYDQLKVAIISTGDELVELGNYNRKSQIVDANRPMLKAQIEQWGYTILDFGIVGDEEALIESVLNEASRTSDIILTTGGASAGDEDHISRLLSQKANLQTWRIALKPGRPLALASWNDIPVLGLPGNPVAAMVCTHIFAYPAFSFLAGAGWLEASGINVPAAFSKNKKAGRTEYLRAKLNADGHAEIFNSEGSGRISGLSWADGLVELKHNTESVEKGNKVKYIPF